ncbi:MAG: carboxypeptidase M32 [Candidatus Bipolaricaulis sp.]|nr:carboxypeptidase M32 [Candidatus Bipolaricaulis sp.]
MDTLTAYRNHIGDMGKLASALSLLGWDQQTHMPAKGVATRSQVTGKLSKMLFELLVSDELGRYLAELRKADGLSELERASIRRVGKNHDRNRAIPPELIEEQSIAQSQAQTAWIAARQANDFAAFRPHLQKMVGYARRFAEYYGYEEHPYDALLEDFEPGMTCRKLKAIIEPLRADLVPFLRRLQENGTPPDTSVLNGTFDAEAQRRLSRRVLELVRYDFDAGGLADVAHPFTTTIGPGDVRITNRYLETQLLSSVFSALHEGGHALYNQGMPEEVYALGLGGGASNGIHESQSRMIENQIGRSLPFWTFFQPVLGEFFPQFKTAKAKDLYAAANVVSPSLVRVEADEVTYNFHIMLRFEIEAGLLDGSIDVADLPRLWNDAMERYLGVVPPNDTQGVLQDVHWSMGYFGYFPSYMLGNLYAAQMFSTIREEVPTLDASIRTGDFEPLLAWLREKVHRHGAACEPQELTKRITGHELDGKHFVRYVTEKYGAIYRL